MLNKQLAYEKWLGIKAYDQPPTLYRLLGVDAFEADPDAISYAADGRMALLRQFQISDNAKLAEQVLTELSRARVVLLNPDQKAAYDAQLREWMAERAAKLGADKLAKAASCRPATQPTCDRPHASGGFADVGRRGSGFDHVELPTESPLRGLGTRRQA